MTNPRSFIKSVADYRPETQLNNSDFESFMETSDAWIKDKVGISSRRVMTDYTGEFPVFEIARRAVDQLAKDPQFNKNEIDFIINCSSVEDRQFPGMGNQMSEYLQLPVPAMNLKNGCASVIFGVHVARGLLQLGYRNILIVNGEPFTRYVDYSDRKSAILFGDASSAMVVSSESGIFEIVNTSVGGFGSDVIKSGRGDSRPQLDVFSATGKMGPTHKPPGCFEQDGRKVMDIVLSIVPEDISAFLAQQGLSTREIKHFIGHQANLNLLVELCKRIAVNSKQHLFNVNNFGNVSSAGWVTVLSENLKRGVFQSEELILASIFGAGMAWGNLLLKGTIALEKNVTVAA